MTARAVAVVACTSGLLAGVVAPSANADPVGGRWSPPPVDPAAWSRIDPSPSAIPGLHELAPCPPHARTGGDDVDDQGGAPLSPWAAELADVPARGAGQTVAVIDTGVARHPRLAGRLVDGADFLADRQPGDCDGHGTAVAGLIAAGPSAADSFEGVAPDARVLAIRQSSEVLGIGDVRGVGDLDTMARAARSAIESPGVGTINISVAACVRPDALDTEPARRLQAAVHEAVLRNVVVVAAAGNVSPTCPQNPEGRDGAPGTVVLPAALDDVVAVAASDSATSVHGPWATVSAPGRGLTSLDAAEPGLTDHLVSPGTSNPTPVTGSSFSAALVSGLVADLRARRPDLGAAAIISRLRGAQRPGPAGIDVRDVLGLPPAANTQRAAPPPGPGDGFRSGAAGVGTAVLAASLGVAAVAMFSVLRMRRKRSRIDAGQRGTSPHGRAELGVNHQNEPGVRGRRLDALAGSDRHRPIPTGDAAPAGEERFRDALLEGVTTRALGRGVLVLALLAAAVLLGAATTFGSGRHALMWSYALLGLLLLGTVGYGALLWWGRADRDPGDLLPGARMLMSAARRVRAVRSRPAGTADRGGS